MATTKQITRQANRATDDAVSGRRMANEAKTAAQRPPVASRRFYGFGDSRAPAKVEKVNRGTESDRLLMEQFRKAEREKCVTPTTVTYSFGTYIYERMIHAIDECVNVLFREKPVFFAYKSAVSPPAIPLNVLRGVYLSAFQRYMYNVGSFAGTTPLSAYNNVKLPYSLAKIFQQFADYVDPMTGTRYKWLCPELVLQLNASYYSIDTYTTPYTYNHLNSPHLRNLIHPTRWGNTTTVEYCSLGNKSFVNYVPNVSDWTTYFSSISPSVLGAINVLAPASIQVSDIPMFAPDASAYCFKDNFKCICPVANFRSDMAYITDPVDTFELPDEYSNFPYDKPRPVVRIPEAPRADSTNSVSQTMTLVGVYFSVLYECKSWKSGSAISLAKTIPRFKTLREFSYRGNSLDFRKAAAKFVAVYKTAKWVGSDGNKAFTLSWMFWSQLYSRLVCYGNLPHASSRDNNSAFYVHNINAVSAVLPGVLAKVISSMGPMVVDGRLYVTQMTATPINALVQAEHSWYQALYDSGVWDVGLNAWSIANGVVPNTSIVVTLPNSTTPFSRADPIGAVYSWNPSALLETYIPAYQNDLPKQLQIDSGCTPSNEILGTVAGSQIAVASSYVPISGAPYVDGLVTISTAELASAAQGNICVTTQQVADALAYSVVQSIVTQADVLKPMIAVFENNAVEIAGVLQRSITPTEDSQFQSMRKATVLDRYSKIKRANTNQDIQFLINNKVLQENYKGFSSQVVPEGSGERESAISRIKQQMTNILKEGGNYLLNTVQVQSQDEEGKLDFKKFFDLAVDVVKTVNRFTQTVEIEENGSLFLLH